MSDKEETVRLPNGTTKTFPAGTSDEYIDNWTERAYRQITSQQNNQAAREQTESPPTPASAPVPEGPPAPADTNMFGGTPLLDRFGLKGLRDAAAPVLKAPVESVPGWIARGLLGKSGALGAGDLGVSLNNIMARREQADELDPTTGPFMGSLDATRAFGSTAGGPLVKDLPYPSEIVGDAIGVPRASPDAPWLERAGESILSFGRNAGAAGRGAVAADTGLRAASPIVQRTVNAAGRVAGGTGAVIGSDLGVEMAKMAGWDPEIGALVGGFAGGTGPSVFNNVPIRLGVQNRLNDTSAPGATTAALRLADATGVTPSPGLIGNQSAARLENTAAGVPLVGQGVRDRQNEQLRQVQTGLYNQTQAMGGPEGQVPMDVDYIGDRMKLIAERGERNRRSQFDQGYAQVDEGVPPSMVVRPMETYLAADRITNPNLYDPDYQGEAASGREAVRTSLANNLEPQIRPSGPYVVDRPVPGGMGHNGGPPLTDQVVVEEYGVPYRDVRPTSNDLWRTADGTPNPASDTAQEQVRGGFLADQARTLMTHPMMVEAFPNPADRAAKVELLNVLTREYRQENASDTKGTGAPEIHPETGEETGGGAFPILKRIQKGTDPASAYREGSKPSNMRVLQRTAAPDDYSGLAANVINQKAQASTPFSDINISPVVFGRWWNGLGANERRVLANNDEGRIQAFNNLANMGDRFRQRSFSENFSNTSPMMSTIGALVAASQDPTMVLGKGAGAAAAASGMASDPMARFMGRTAPESFEMIMRRALDAARATGGIVADPRQQ